MIGKTHASDALPFALPEIGVLELAGPDAAAFLQAQSMNDVRALADGHWQWNGCLSARGRVLALFALLRLDATRYWAVLPDGDAAFLHEHLRRYVFRAKVRLQALEDLHAVGMRGEAPAGAADASGARAAVAADGMVRLDWSGADRRSVVLGADVPERDAGNAWWRREDVRHGLPRLGAAQRDAFTPQMLSLERLQAFSLTKGCYPGQEIVARTHYLGQARRTLHLLRVDGVPAADAELLQAGRPVGRLVCTAPDGDACLALAVAAAPEPDGALQAGGFAARIEPLVPGLAR